MIGAESHTITVITYKEHKKWIKKPQHHQALLNEHYSLLQEARSKFNARATYNYPDGLAFAGLNLILYRVL